jgi:hypothetical protein
MKILELLCLHENNKAEHFALGNWFGELNCSIDFDDLLKFNWPAELKS